ncbi:MAG: MBL fold metallo-hydrolase [Bacteroidales bacterium]|nr:MBL fold metallo-hydrolase [Bacteroidales bacterium]MBQ2107286.1 MBL fold metallo-hydrolase [Bacteroidales bacterium]
MVRQLSEKVFYIGSDDLDIDLFESQYIVPEGVSYNSYLIRDSKIAVLDTSDARKGEEWLASLNEALAGREPDYLVVHHMEPDHSALIAKALHLYPSVKLVASAQALRMLPQFFQDIKLEGRTIAIKEGDTLPLGTHTLHFVAAPMVHWPEVMVSFDDADGVLYSADGFGKFGALGKCGFYGRDDDDWACEARRYYFNIVGKYGAQVQQLLKKAAALPIKAIRPLHGPLLEDNLQEYIHLYDVWSRYDSESEGIFIACASIHGGTLAAAEMLAQILRTKGAGKVVVSDLSRTDIAENVEDAFRYPKIILAAASYDAGLFTPMYEFLHRLQIKGWQRKKVGLLENGSWAPSAGRVMKEMLGTMKDIEIVEPMVTIRSRMHREDFPAMDELAEAILK